MAACTTNQKGNATGSRWSSVEEEVAGGVLVNEDSNPSLVYSTSALIGSDPDEEVVQEEATPEFGQMAAPTGTNQRGDASKATSTSCGSMEEDGGNREEEEDSKPSLVTSSSALLTGFYPDQEVVQEEEATTTPDEIPSGWTRVKLEPDC
jgi:hypothetical protein